MARLRKTARARRRHAAVFALLITLVGILVVVPSATAVHDLDLFELDGNAVDNGLPSPFGGDDWDDVFAGTDSAIATSFETDLFNDPDDSILTGGATKDDLNINGGPGNGWLCKQGGAVDKNDLEHAFAAAYAAPNGDVILYFGADKFSVSGDAQIGFWFFQGEVGCDPTGAQSTAFTGTHQVGDLLILSDFTNGGDVSTIRAFEWVGTGGNTNDTLDSLPSGVDCDDAGLGDDLCAQVNPVGNETTGGWTYMQKNNLIGPPPKAAAGNYPKGAFYEGGVNLTELLGEEGVSCFTTFMAETRQSQSVDSVLEDFSIGTFDTCAATIQTTPSSGSITLGQSITDQAVIEGTGIGAPAPTGMVSFFVCGPLAAGDLCETGGTAVGTVDLSANTDNPVTVVSNSFTPTAPGRYCFRAELTDDPNYDDVADSGENECFTVTDTSSVATAQNWRPNDSATVTSTGGSTLDGSVAFTLYDNGTCDGAVLYTETREIAAGTSSPATVSTTNDGTAPGDVLVSADATVSWRAVFTSDDPNVSGNTSGCEVSTLDIEN